MDPMRKIFNHHPVASIVLAEIPESSAKSEQGIVQFILSRGLAKLAEAESIARDIRSQIVAA